MIEALLVVVGACAVCLACGFFCAVEELKKERKRVVAIERRMMRPSNG